jgi:hypothetical protein
MSAINKALDEIKFRIPRQILDVAFMDEVSGWRRSPMGLDELMMLKVIRPRVLYDCNLVGGQMANVSLENLQPVYDDNYTFVYSIPKERTQNRSILSALSISYMPYGAMYGAAGVNYGAPGGLGSSIVATTGQRVGDAVSAVPPVSLGYVDLVGENTIMFRDNFRVTQAYFLRCILANEENLANLNPRSYPAFSKLCELAIKSYLYNNLIIKIDQAYLQGGQELGSFKNYVENLADSEQMYQDYLKEVWQAVSFANDIHSYDRLIKLQINPAI